MHCRSLGHYAEVPPVPSRSQVSPCRHQLDCECLTTSMKLSRSFMHMLMDLFEFNLMVQHWPGKQNVVVPTCSRLACATVLPSDDLSWLQHDNPECANLRAEILRDSRSATDFFVLDDILYCRASLQLSVIVIPAVMRQPALELMRDGNGHMNCA